MSVLRCQKSEVRSQLSDDCEVSVSDLATHTVALDKSDVCQKLVDVANRMSGNIGDGCEFSLMVSLIRSFLGQLFGKVSGWATYLVAPFVRL